MRFYFVYFQIFHANFWYYSGFIRSKDNHCDENNNTILKTFITQSENQSELVNTRNECERYCLGNDGCWGCSLSCQQQCRWNALTECHRIRNMNGIDIRDVTEKPGKYNIDLFCM